jgi:FAD/FMN-containing dehydrogenase
MTALSLGEFANDFRGQLLLPSTDTYDAARKVWNGMIDRRPSCIAMCKTVDDVQSALRFARANDLPIAIRGGGHNAAGLSVCDDGIVIDLREMNTVVVDPAKKTARAGGGTTWADFDGATAKHGLATTGGAISSTGIAGLTLGGGLGWLMRSYGLACDNMIGATVVTADGSVMHASETENSDLLWALRGGGGNFGIVTEFEFALHPVSTVLGGMLVYPLQWAKDVLRVYKTVVASAPDALTVFAILTHSPDGHPVIALAICYNGPVEDGERAIKRIRDFATPVAGAVGPIPYTALQTMLDAGLPSGLNVHWRSEFVTTVPDALIDAVVASYEDATSPLNVILIEQLGGAVGRVARDATAFDHRDSDYNLVIVGRWTDPTTADKHVSWARETSASVKPFTSGRVYVNYIGAGEAPDRVRAAFSPEKFAELAKVKTKFDPQNVFRMNQNIPPG